MSTVEQFAELLNVINESPDRTPEHDKIRTLMAIGSMIADLADEVHKLRLTLGGTDDGD